VDQLLAGWYGGLAVELMALGKPVISYIRESDLKFIPQEMRKDLPIISAAPATIYSVLKEWLTVRRDELPKVGQSSRAYVEKWHDPVKIAARLKSEYEAILANRKSRRERSKTQGSLR
jgi:glycosyltransferase involved in cell wall biosynthesis